jgi:multiple sugar transport system permease protein
MKTVTAGHGRGKWTNYLYLLPAAALIGVFFISSIFYTLWLSFHTADGFSEPIFAGLENYRYLFSDPNFTTSLANTLIWVGLLAGDLVCDPAAARHPHHPKRPCDAVQKYLLLPNVLSATIAGLIIRSMISVYGLPQLFGSLGLNSWVCDWLALARVNTFIMIGCSVWQGIGMNLLLFIVGINNIDASPIEAATIEGAGTTQLYTRVVFPLLKPTSIVILLMSLVNSFKVFDSIWVMTKGGPYRSSETLALTMYEESFIRNKLGLGAAVAIVLTVIILVVSYFNVRSTFKPENVL